MLTAAQARRIAILGAIVIVLFAVAAPLLLPARFSSDANNIVDIAEGYNESGSPSFAVMALITRVLSKPGFTLLVIGTGAIIVVMLLSRRRRLATLALAVWLLIAMVPLELVRPQKEIIVIFLTAAVLTALKTLKPYFALPVILGFYVIYSYLGGRDYYFLITGAVFFFYAVSMLQWRLQLAVVILVLLAGWLVPARVLLDLTDIRNGLNQIRVLFPDVSGDRTAFLNPFTGADWPSFVGNYVYGTLRLNIPILFMPGISEFYLFLYCISVSYLVLVGLRPDSDWRVRFCACAVAGHIAVLWLFEPDLGSYLRHMASTTLYLMPILNKLDRSSSESGRQPLRVADSNFGPLQTGEVSPN